MELTQEDVAENERFARNTKLAALFTSEGWKVFENELVEERSQVCALIDRLTALPITDVRDLNLAIARRYALDAIFLKVAELQEELEPSV